MKIEEVEEVVNDNNNVTNKLDPIENGYVYDNYKWTQNAKDVSLYIPLDYNIKSKDLIIKFSPNHLFVGIKNQEPIFDGELFSVVKAENSTWLMNTDSITKELVIELDKKKFDEWWGSVFKGEQELDMSKIRPPTANITDLDAATRATIDKMLYDQEQKEKQGFYKDIGI